MISLSISANWIESAALGGGGAGAVAESPNLAASTVVKAGSGVVVAMCSVSVWVQQSTLGTAISSIGFDSRASGRDANNARGTE